MNRAQKLDKAIQLLHQEVGTEEFERRESEYAEYSMSKLEPVERKIYVANRKIMRGWTPDSKEQQKLKRLEAELQRRDAKGELLFFKGYEHLIPKREELEEPETPWYRKLINKLKWDFFHWKRFVKEWWEG